MGGGQSWETTGSTLCSCSAIQPHGPVAAGVLDPGVINGWGHGRGHSAGADVPNDVERLLERVVHAQHVVPPLGLVGRLFHEAALVRRRV